LIDPILTLSEPPTYPGFMGTAITNITNEIINNISLVQINSALYQNLANIDSITIDNTKFYYNSLFNIMTQGLTSINLIVLINSNGTQTVTINNVVTNGLPISNNDGYISVLYKTYPTNHIQLGLILGDIFNIIQAVPIPIQPNMINSSLSCTITYGSMYDNIPLLITATTNIPLNRGALDMFMFLNQDLTTNNTTDVVNYYNKILGYFDILINGTNIINVTTNTINPDTIYIQFLSSENNPGNLFLESNTNNNPNPLGYTNTNIVRDYYGFSSVYGIIKFLLDIIIYDISISNSIFNTIFSNNFNINVNNLMVYYQNTIIKYSDYLNIMTINGITFIDSQLYGELTPLRNTLNGNNIAEFAWSEYIGYNMIDYISITMGGQEIDRHSGTWLYLDYLMNKDINHKRGLDIMVGNIRELKVYDKTPKGKYNMYIPLRFWFCKYANTSLPLIALQHSEVFIDIKLKDLENIAYWNKKHTYFRRKLKLKSYILADYIYLDIDERTRFAEMKHEYLIDTVQRNGIIHTRSDSIMTSLIDSSSFLDSESHTTEQRLYFSNMCKDLVWIFKFEKKNPTEKEKKNLILNWTDFSLYSNKKNIIEFQLKFNDSYREQWKRTSYYNLVQPYVKEYSSLTDNIFLYSFSLHPKYLQPSGAVNLDKISDISIVAHITPEIAEQVENGTMIMKWDIYNRSTNILRIMSGMSGMAFYGSQY
jgi:hypothetical protein